MAWQLRLGGGGDLDAIMAIENSSFGSDAWSAGAMREELEGEHRYYLVAFHPETPQSIEGYAGLLAPEGSPDAEIQTIAVREHARRTGLGRVLMLALIEQAGRRGATALHLEVRADNPAAEAMYLALGFRQIAVRARYYQPDGIDAHVMRLPLAKVRLGPAVGS